MLNASSVQRGLFCLTSYHTIDASEKKRDTYSYEEICVPPQSSGKNIEPTDPRYFRRKNANYSLLDENGIVRHRIPRPGDPEGVGHSVYVKKGDVLVGKVVVTGNKGGEETKVDASVVVQQGEEGYIDKVHVMLTPNGYKLVKIVIRVSRVPTVGDKLASAMAQKGTIGMLYRQEDMPFSGRSGIVPDLIISPSCIPSQSGSRV